MNQPLKRVLLAEDEDDIREVVTLLLESLGGFTVKSCVDGATALDVAESFEPDLILSDVMMPEMDGMSVLRTVKKTPALCKIPVVFMTARAQSHEIKAYMAMGAAEVIPKPFDPSLIAEKLEFIWQNYDIPGDCQA